MVTVRAQLHHLMVDIFMPSAKKISMDHVGFFNEDDAAITYRNKCFLCPPTTAVAAPSSTDAIPLDSPVATQQSVIVSA